ncbi:hypothetical protein [Winogradskyella psychrotolerans]|uniref:hypothetical protein n=1 Tax=Winogradskyella psychrotolerans TaxID=1344585 RepID=UPI001C067708|nr:hypothetical protein [Winogradskyella psychrotolerans]MBU2929726.1 hypothetical protein [Winogradskyella psychrotolerans]
MKYFDFNGKEFLEKELRNYKDYHKAELNENGSFRLIETYQNSELDSLNAFIESELETKLFFENYPNLEIIEFCQLQERKGNYCKFFNFYINKHNIKSGGSVIVIENGNLLPIYENNNEDNDRTNKSLWKYYYFYDLNVEFEFEYDSNGEFKQLSVYDVNMICDSDNTSIYPNNVGIGKNDFNFNWKGMEYYKNSEPIIPNGEITTHNTVYN